VLRLFRKTLRENPVFLLALGALLGALAQANWKVTTIVAGSVAVACLVRSAVNAIIHDYNAKRKAKYFTDLRKPGREACMFAEKHGHTEVVVGNVIEIWAHHSLETMQHLHDLGVDPQLVIFSAPNPRDFSHSVQRCGGLKMFSPPNQRKYGISKLPLNTMDDQNFTVEFFETDCDTWLTVRTAIEKDLQLRHELSHIVPEKSHVPQSMSLQFIVRFSNRDILAMKRKEGLASEPGKWSFSSEEQLHEHDFRSQSVSVAEHLFRRAFIEEIFGHRGEDEVILNRIWTEDCTRIVRSHRIWSFFLEENTGIFQTFGVFQLKINAEDLRKSHTSAVSAGWGSTDPEGHWYVVRNADIEKLLVSGACDAHRLHGDPERTIIQDQHLHATSRYRLWRLYTALRRKPETMDSLNLK
jgi:hypothetical protein